MVEIVHLSAGEACLALAPELGGGIARLDVAGVPVLRSWDGDESDPFSLACNLLVPFSNRISGGGFVWENRFRAVEPNLPGEPCPIHGDGFQRRWDVTVQGSTAILSLAQGRIGPWRYRAWAVFSLAPDRLAIELSVTNTGQTALPFGYGLHPWFPRTQQTCVAFEARTVWLEDNRHLPVEEISVTSTRQFDYRKCRPLSDRWVNNGFSGWNGRARIEQGRQALSCTLTASEDLGTLILYAPDKDAPFFCLEPVSHPVDAFNLPGMPGLQNIAPLQEARSVMRLNW